MPSEVIPLERGGRAANRGVLERYGETELSRKLAVQISGEFRYVPEWKSWLRYVDGVWRTDVAGAVKMEAKRLCDEIADVVREDPAFGAMEKRERAALRFQSKHTVDAVLDLAKVEPCVIVRSDLLDSDLDLLNTPAGTIDLRSGEMRPHRREDLITKSTSIAPSVCECPNFCRFMVEITRDDFELIEYLQRALGACLSGARNDHWLMFWYGSGRNGKNTLGDLVAQILGDYAKRVPTETLMTDPRGNRHPTEIATLRGVRLAISSEVSEGEHLHESRVKELTGDAILTARFMRQDFFEFKRTHKHLIYGNHRPLLRILDPAIAARLHIVPFEATFSQELGNLDPLLPEKLREEAPAVLAWLIKGHLKWRQEGTLIRCPRVAACTQDYLASQATLEHWIDESCQIVGDDGRAGRRWHKASELYLNYGNWKRDRGEHPLSQTRWGEQMKGRFSTVSANGIRYVGVLLKVVFP